MYNNLNILNTVSELVNYKSTEDKEMKQKERINKESTE